MFFLLISCHSCFHLFFYVTSWRFPDTRHQVDLDISFKAYVNTYKGNTVVCSCLHLTARLSVDTDRAFVCLQSCQPLSRLLLSCLTTHRSLFFMLGLSRNSGLWSPILGWRSLSAMLCTHCCRAAVLRWQHSRIQEVMRGTTDEERKVTWKLGVDDRFWGNHRSPCWNMEAKMSQVISCSPLLDTVSPGNVLTGLLIWRSMLCSAVW